MALVAADLILAGGAVFPGLTDAHGHVAGLGRRLLSLDLRGADSVERGGRARARPLYGRPPGRRLDHWRGLGPDPLARR